MIDVYILVILNYDGVVLNVKQINTNELKQEITNTFTNYVYLIDLVTKIEKGSFICLTDRIIYKLL